MMIGSHYLYWLIVGCETAFWVILALALAARYLLRRQAVSRILLFALPAVDIALLLFTAVDLRSGAPATFAHGLATAYVGFTVAFGPVVVRWADGHVAHWFGSSPTPVVTSAHGWAAVRGELLLWLRCVAAWIITVAALIGVIAFVDDEAVTRELSIWFRIAFGSSILWFVFGPAWTLVSLGRKRAT